jgi:hypothetical protein
VSFADWMGAPTVRGGLGMPTWLVAVLWALGIEAVAAYLAVVHRRRINGATGAAAAAPSVASE